MQLEHKINLPHTKVYAYFPSVTNIKMATRKLPCRKHHPELIFFKEKKKKKLALLARNVEPSLAEGLEQRYTNYIMNFGSCLHLGMCITYTWLHMQPEIL